MDADPGTDTRATLAVQEKHVYWKNRLSQELGDVKDTPDGFSMAVPIPVDDDGYFGRACPACKRLFKMLHIEYEALPDDLELTCPYCGERREHSEFLTADQLERMRSAGLAVAEQYVYEALGDMLERTFGRSPSGSRGGLVSIEWSYRPGHPPMPRRLYEYVEEQVRRTFACRRCSTHTAICGAAAFCPVCGPREAVEEVREAIAAQRLALALPDQLSEDLREQARAAGVFDQHAESAIKEVVTLTSTRRSDQPNQTVAQSTVGHRLSRERDFIRWDRKLNERRARRLNEPGRTEASRPSARGGSVGRSERAKQLPKT
jgi:sarcosine oxidase delta subunit